MVRSIVEKNCPQNGASLKSGGAIYCRSPYTQVKCFSGGLEARLFQRPNLLSLFQGVVMWLVLLGLFQILLYAAEVGPFAKWTWHLSGEFWLFTWPFIAAVIWWAWADGSGYNARKEMKDLDQRREDRRAKNLVDLGMGHKVNKKRR